MFLCLPEGALQTEVAFGVAEANALDNGAQGLFIGGILAVFDPGAEQLTEDAAEILVPGVGEEAALVGQHSDEAGQISLGG